MSNSKSGRFAREINAQLESIENFIAVQEAFIKVLKDELAAANSLETAFERIALAGKQKNVRIEILTNGDVRTQAPYDKAKTFSIADAVAWLDGKPHTRPSVVKIPEPKIPEAEQPRWPGDPESPDAKFLGQYGEYDLWYRVREGVPQVDWWYDGIGYWNWTNNGIMAAPFSRFSEAWRRAKALGLPTTAEEVKQQAAGTELDGAIAPESAKADAPPPASYPEWQSFRDAVLGGEWDVNMTVRNLARHIVEVLAERWEKP